MDLRTELKKLRPTLSDGSLTTYCSILRSLHSKIFGGDIKKSDYDESDKILKHLDDLPPNKRKTILSALVVISGKPDYRKEMLDDIRNILQMQKRWKKQKPKRQTGLVKMKYWRYTTNINKTRWRVIRKVIYQ